jgi:hypothetical protein
MRLWTLHPQYLDAKGLVALWREALLAQAVLRGRTLGYRHHPQLVRFAAVPVPEAAMASYLVAIHEEAVSRGYRFGAEKIGPLRFGVQIDETKGQLLYEWHHLKRKLQARDPERYARHQSVDVPSAHPIFRIIEGGVRKWEHMR